MRRVLAGLVALAALLGGAGPAFAGPDQESIVQDDNLLLYRGDAVADKTFDELDELGVDRVRLSVPWRALAPRFEADRKPSPLRYREAAFHPWDHALRAAKARNIDVLFNVTGGAPRWATGRRDGKFVSRQYKPSPREFAAFVAMLGRRYDGRRHPRVTAWSIWNEPNFGAFLQPQWENGRPASPRIYRGLVRAALRGLRASGHGGDEVLLGETSPYGNDRRTPRSPIRPALFLRELFCLDLDLRARSGCSFGPRLEGITAYGHHPYPIKEPPDRSSAHPDDIRLADAARLVLTLDAAAAAGRIKTALPIWYTEFGWQTLPDPIRGIGLVQHAAWLARAERMTWLDPRVKAMAQFQLRDDPPRRQFSPRSRLYWGTYQAGLRFADGRPKPAYDAYRLTLDAPSRLVGDESLRLWGLVRAARNGSPTSVQLELRRPGSSTFEPVGDPVEVNDPRGYFEIEPPQESGTWRYRWREHASNAVTVTVG